MHELKHPYISIKYGTQDSFGGNQERSESPSVRAYGCGIIAAVDLLIYMSRWKTDSYPKFLEAFHSNPIDGAEYNRLIDSMRRRYFHLIPKSGMTGIGLMLGMQLFMRQHGLPYTARWCFDSKLLWTRIEEMLENDFPVIISVGPNLTFSSSKKGTIFYRKINENLLSPSLCAKSHFMTVTSVEGDLIEVSSWGKRLYIKKAEFIEYAKKQSLGFLCNILYISHK